jgi:signal transduction histidine kinase
VAKRIPSWLRKPDGVRRLAYGVAGLIAVLALLPGTTNATGGYCQACMAELTGWLWLLLPVALAAAVWLPRRRAQVFAVAAAVVGLTNTTDSPNLGIAAGVFVFISICEDAKPRPWLGWLAGGVGATGSALVMFLVSGLGPSPSAFLLVGVGYLLAMLLRSWIRRIALAQEASDLRGQAVWLEQRANLARELHDVVGHHVTAMVVQAEAGQLSDDSGAALRAIAESGRTALGELDALVVHLRDPNAVISTSAPPRLSDIDELLAEPLRQQGVAVQVRLDPDPGLDEIGVVTAYRIAQEALTNVARHARAGAAWVELARVGERVRLRISDDGIGPPKAPGRGSGLLGIDERVRARGGSWELSERPGGGTMLEANLPAAAA